MLRVTFDTNILIDLEENRTGYDNIKKIIELHDQKQLKICIPAISASEKILDQKKIPNYTLFQNFLSKLYIYEYEELMPIMYCDISFWNHALWADDEMSELDHKIHKILFPKIEPEHKDYCKARSLELGDDKVDPKWRNAKIDVQMLWSHLFHCADIFITRDKNFKRNHDKLIDEIGPMKIMDPSEFLQAFSS